MGRKLFFNLPQPRRVRRTLYGWMEIGQDDEPQSFVRVLDIGYK